MGGARKVRRSRRVPAPQESSVDVTTTTQARVSAAKRGVAAAVLELIDAVVDERTGGADWVTAEHTPFGRETFNALCRSGALPARKAGRKWSVRRRDLDAYLESHGRANPDTDSVEGILRKVVGA